MNEQPWIVKRSYYRLEIDPEKSVVEWVGVSVNELENDIVCLDFQMTYRDLYKYLTKAEILRWLWDEVLRVYDGRRIMFTDIRELGIMPMGLTAGEIMERMEKSPFKI